VEHLTRLADRIGAGLLHAHSKHENAQVALVAAKGGCRWSTRCAASWRRRGGPAAVSRTATSTGGPGTPRRPAWWPPTLSSPSPRRCARRSSPAGWTPSSAPSPR
jgi:hypothetical protein